MFGGGASHLVVETALTTQPNVVLLNEECIEKRLSLGDVVSRLADLVAARSEKGKNFGVVLVPEGAIISVPELRSLIKELDAIFAKLERKKGETITMQEALDRLTGWSAALLQSLPTFIQEQLLLPRQSDGKLSLGSVETEKLLATLVGAELKRRSSLGSFSGKYSFVTDSIDYKARSSVPSNFDCDLAYSHGIAAAALIANGAHGYLTCLSGLGLPASQWVSSAVPLVSLLSVDYSASSGEEVKVSPTLVSMSAPEIQVLKSRRGDWELSDAYCNPGPLQFGDDTRLQKFVHRGTDYLFELNKVNSSLKSLSKALGPGVQPERLRIASSMIENILDIIMEKKIDAQSSIMSPSSEHWSETFD
jgi:diphosphate--fructose-6-phosphate 1-phosphotransferase